MRGAMAVIVALHLDLGTAANACEETYADRHERLMIRAYYASSACMVANPAWKTGEIHKDCAELHHIVDVMEEAGVLMLDNIERKLNEANY